MYIQCMCTCTSIIIILRAVMSSPANTERPQVGYRTHNTLCSRHILYQLIYMCMYTLYCTGKIIHTHTCVDNFMFIHLYTHVHLHSCTMYMYMYIDMIVHVLLVAIHVLSIPCTCTCTLYILHLEYMYTYISIVFHRNKNLFLNNYLFCTRNIMYMYVCIYVCGDNVCVLVST